MRPAWLAALAVVCALVGGAAALTTGRLAGWVGPRSATTVFRASPLLPDSASAVPAAVESDARPLAGNGFDPSRIYAVRAPGVVTIFSEFGSDPARASIAQGSGFVVSKKGYILTNSHVITNAGEGAAVHAADRVYVEFQDRDRVAAKVVGWDVFDDVGLLKVDPSGRALDPVPLGNSAAIVVGEPVAAIGSPFGNEDSLGVGVVSAIHRSIDSLTSNFSLVDAIQTDAPINHGNSGGPLFDARGRVIGINAQIRSDSGNAEGVGFAVPINSARRSLQQLIANGAVSYAFVGVVTTDLTPAMARHFGYAVDRGAAITKVEPHSPAAAAHLQADGTLGSYLGVDFPKSSDVIIAIDHLPVRSSEDVVRIVTDRLSPGQLVHFTIVRDGKRIEVPVRLSERTGKP
ncbi:MAG TPA: trypsin-like peptidase domain-containing protein [Gaiellaceae bacterium]|nr:trypsin-like peptidase domain-containing protein [Gaiellaceae bacterium]